MIYNAHISACVRACVRLCLTRILLDGHESLAPVQEQRGGDEGEDHAHAGEGVGALRMPRLRRPRNQEQDPDGYT